jgi:hypothetical protein
MSADSTRTAPRSDLSLPSSRRCPLFDARAAQDPAPVLTPLRDIDTYWAILEQAGLFRL